MNGTSEKGKNTAYFYFGEGIITNHQLSPSMIQKPDPLSLTLYSDHSAEFVDTNYGYLHLYDTDASLVFVSVLTV